MSNLSKPRKGTRITIVWEVAAALSVEETARLCEEVAGRHLQPLNGIRPMTIDAVPCTLTPQRVKR